LEAYIASLIAFVGGSAYLASVAAVVFAEMGDKTQLLGMAFATRIKWYIVLAGVLVATVANHALAVGLGYYLTTVVPINIIQIVAALSFILFGLWTIRGDQLEGQEKKNYINPFWTVTVGFFIAEMGDKTQIMSIALAAQWHDFGLVLLGTTTGMLISNAIGIIVGVVLGKKIPERVVKLFSAAIFIFFGYWGVYENVEDQTLKLALLAVSTLVVAGYILYLRRKAPLEPAVA
jgi:Ca2+/H+ antiporter, TMEM165/GDT1 family